MHRASREVTSMGQGTKQIDRMVVVHSSSSTSKVQGFATPANSGNDFQIFSRVTIESIETGKRKSYIGGSKISACTMRNP